MTFWWKLSIFITVVIAYTASVWRVHDWYDGNKETSQAIVAANKAEAGQSQIIKYDQKLRTVYVKTKDNCLNVAMPDDVRKLLAEPTKLP